MRKYEYETGRFISIDPLWSKYYGWTPYQYSMNSPVMLVDFGGEKVQGLDESARLAIKGSVEARFEQFVRFDSDGMLDAKFLKNNLPADIDVNSNAHTLMRIAENPKLATVSVQSNFTVYSSNGKSKEYEFFGKGDKTYYPKGGAIETLFYDCYTVTPDGPDAESSDMYSGDNITKIYLNPNRASTTGSRESDVAHELFWHFRLYLMNIKNGHIPKGENGEGGDPPHIEEKYRNIEKKANE